MYFKVLACGTELGHTERKREKRKCCHRLEVCQLQREYKACQQCIGEYYLDLKTFSSSRSCTEISVLTQMCRKGQCLQQITANELGHSVHRFNLPLVVWLMSPFASMTLGEGNSLGFFMIRQECHLGMWGKRRKEQHMKTEVCTASPRLVMDMEALLQ